MHLREKLSGNFEKVRFIFAVLGGYTACSEPSKEVLGRDSVDLGSRFIGIEGGVHTVS